jgi:hypothetical protein
MDNTVDDATVIHFSLYAPPPPPAEQQLSNVHFGLPPPPTITVLAQVTPTGTV